MALLLGIRRSLLRLFSVHFTINVTLYLVFRIRQLDIPLLNTNNLLYYRIVEQSNIATSEDFRREYVQRQNQMDGLVGSHIDSQTKFCDTLRVSLFCVYNVSYLFFIIRRTARVY